MLVLIRHSVLMLTLIAVFALSGCGGKISAPQPIPITSAAIVGDGKGRFTLAWTAPEDTIITIYAGTDPVNIGRNREVGAGGANGHIIVSLPAGPRWYFEFVPQRGGTLLMAERNLHLTSIPNLRDVGGYRTSDGRWVKMGKLFRSDQLDKVTDEDFIALSSLGLKLICDFRSEVERAAGADRVPTGAAHMIADVIGDKEHGFMKILGDTNAVMTYLSATPGEQIMLDGYRSKVTAKSSIEAYNATFNRLADPYALPALFHCTAGKDRTGWSTAILLTLLGVPQETVMHHFMLSNRYLIQKNDLQLAALPPDLAKAMLPLVEVREEYLQAAFDEVQKTYGSFNAYIKDGLGLSEKTISDLKNNFLTPDTAQ